ncbi:MAG: M23 family metallopeptidase, partial [Alphaproteobacteria bacterium]
RRLTRGAAWALILWASALAPAAAADDWPADPPVTPPVTLEGALEQGALVMGTTVPGANVTLDGASVPVAPDGRFLIGFAFDARAHSVLRVEAAGAVAKLPLAVERRTYEVERIEGLPEDKVTPPAAEMARIKREASLIQEARARETGTALFTHKLAWPVHGILSGVYGSRRILNGEPRAPHLGVDIAAAAGTPIKAATEGTVILARPDFFFTGNTVMIDHGLGLTTVYAHLSHMAVHEGDHVEAGQTIGQVGMTGRATAPHLHWGVHLRGLGLDPALIAGAMAPAPTP